MEKSYEEQLAKVREDFKTCTSAIAMGILVEHKKWLIQKIQKSAPSK